MDFNIRAAEAVSRILKEAQIEHLIVGGAATTVLGLCRPSNNVDVLLHGSIAGIREMLIAKNPQFRMIGTQTYFFDTPDSQPFVVNLLQAGPNAGGPIFLNIASIRAIWVDEVPYVHPSANVLLKVGRWRQLVDSVEADKKRVAMNDAQDIAWSLQWLARFKEELRFNVYDSEQTAQLRGDLEYFVHKHADSLADLHDALPSVPK